MKENMCMCVHVRVVWQDMKDTSHYVHSEMEALDREQMQIDKRASLLEQKLRRVMDTGLGTRLNPRF